MKNKQVDAYMKTAFTFSECSTATKMKVGAIIVDPETGAIVSVGYNGTLPGSCNTCEKDGKTIDEVLHAEENAIAKLARNGYPASGKWMFVTHSPCVKCARLMIASGIEHVFYANGYQSKRSIGDGLPLLRKHCVNVFKWTTNIPI